ncbi:MULTISPECIES: LysR family transcriptional regulator [Pseudonocardia]|uniref:HTH-type transcriptional regulator BenM n=2 Tax=Pseudonocardia TaxID=1847 RepID=A0A1Y2MWA7_PSEAH|nr:MULTISPECIES: LysR family transcriptional regulator [Pseudonocardia]OSY39470.1 HTH-type transcriptional regulator BenM [Pseudonocardia autotrophica]TDN75292.1 DNA-binding transcriptional LysR family regulator [Pseudonocardia autotrophica]BBF99238.1 LysR family transcriptional regulator [Pseudonocardia autotrophica]GEC24784.1 LysR family transcriptional regulator [Pseudonocardia saturnea]
MDIEALRTFVAVAGTGQFQAAADELGISQQAASKRIAALERHVGATLLVRTSRGSRLSVDGQIFLPHAKKVMATIEQAEHAVRPGHRPLRVDVLNRRISPAQAVYRFYRSHPETDLDAVTLGTRNAAQAAQAVLEGTVDATFRALPADQIPTGISAERLLDEPLELLVGPGHPLADMPRVSPADLHGHRIWIPGIRPGTEWAAFYRSLSEAFGLSIDALGPDFGDEALMDTLADSAELATLVGSGDRYLWPRTHDLRRIPLHDPTPVYPHVLLFRSGDRHPVLTALRDHLRASGPRTPPDVWTPAWSGR